MKDQRTRGWISPAEANANSPQDVRFAAPVDRKGQFNDLYSFDVFKYGHDSKLLAVRNHEVRLTDARTLEVTIDGNRLVFHEKQRSSRNRSFPYLGGFDNPDFHYRLVELEPAPFDLVDELFLSSGLVLIGCDPAAHYRGWTALDVNPSKVWNSEVGT